MRNEILFISVWFALLWTRVALRKVRGDLPSPQLLIYIINSSSFISRSEMLHFLFLLQIFPKKSCYSKCIVIQVESKRFPSSVGGILANPDNTGCFYNIFFGTYAQARCPLLASLKLFLTLFNLVYFQIQIKICVIFQNKQYFYYLVLKIRICIYFFFSFFFFFSLFVNS